MTARNQLESDKIYRRGYRLYNRIFGQKLHIQERGHDNQPAEELRGIATVGTILLEGWISA